MTVYQGQALMTREVSVPEGEGNVELIVTPLSPQTVDNSLYTEGADGLRVLSTRFRTRAVKEDTRQEVRAQQDLLKMHSADAQKIQNKIAVDEQDLQYLQKLEGFTGATLTSLTRQGRLKTSSSTSGTAPRARRILKEFRSTSIPSGFRKRRRRWPRP